MDVRAVGIKALKNKLSEYVRLAAGGETVLVVDRDRVVAELVPPQAGRAPELHDAQLAEAVRAGLLTPPAIAFREPPPRSPVMSWKELAHGLDEDREER
jgi:antitoxin (DNA-binding transcriptional repressor) of toxin-antitoxin stability system